MDARSNSKKPIKSSKDKDKKSTNKPTSPMEEGEITIHTSEEDMSIIAADKNETNQPIFVDNEDKPTSTSPPKRKAKDDQGPPKKKMQTENNDRSDNDDKIIDGGNEEIKEIRMDVIEKSNCGSSCEERL